MNDEQLQEECRVARSSMRVLCYAIWFVLIVVSSLILWIIL